MVIRLVFLFLVTLSAATYGQNPCISITRSGEYYTASATNADENEARTNARSLLIEQISATISSRTDFSTTETTAAYKTSYSNQTRSVSQLYMSGIKYLVCGHNKREGVTVMAYISKQDLEKSKEEISRKVGEYLELMEQKRLIGADYVPDAYTAYLYTFLTPYPIAYATGSIKTNDARAYLESFFTSMLSRVKLVCTDVEENKEFPEQLLLHLRVEGIEPSSMKFIFDSPEFNARCEVVNMTGAFNVLMDPVSSSQTFKGIVTLKPLTISQDLVEVDRSISLSRGMDILANMKPVISVDFSLETRGEDLQVTPIIKHLSVRTFQWASEGRVLSSDQRPILSLKDINHTLTLTINANADLSVTKSIDGTVEKSSDQRVVDPIAEQFGDVESFPQLQPLLLNYKKDGKVLFGRKADFIKPSNCWIFLVDPNTQKVLHLLGPETASGRTDIKSNKTFTDFEKQIKGLTSIWVEFF